jgi:DNA-binding response OmpR family regulator/HPt (histidine-containing phosphotransfer) domain-containing protein
MRILLVDDDPVLLEILTQRLSAENYAIDTAADGSAGWEYVSTYEYDLLILDVLLPAIDGLSLCKKIRSAEYTMPILLLTGQNSRDAKLTGWDAGADDYVVKPFDEAELMARIRALLRRSQQNPLPILTWGDLWLNTNTNEASYGDQELVLTAKEYTLLEMMLRDCQHVFSNDEILDRLWTAEDFPAEATVRSHVRRLRHKLSAIGAPADFITTAYGHGYFLKPLDAGAETAIVSQAVGQTIDQTIGHQTPASSSQPATLDPLDQAAQYHHQLNQTWQKHQSTCLAKVEALNQAIGQLATQGLSPAAQAEAYHLAHTLSGTLGTFGLHDAMAIARQIEQEIHPDLYLEPMQAMPLAAQVAGLERIVSQTHSLPPLPLTEARPETRHRSSSHPDQPPVRVMVVDDDPIFLQTIGGQLQARDFVVATLSDPAQFWPMLENTNPDILLLDIQMPQINGLELCAKLRRAPHWQKLPVMFLSILGDAQTQHRAFAAGADDYLAKPITAQHLGDRIRQRLQRIQLLSRP